MFYEVGSCLASENFHKHSRSSESADIQTLCSTGKHENNNKQGTKGSLLQEIVWKFVLLQPTVAENIIDPVIRSNE